jgi:hypothetical protein
MESVIIDVIISIASFIYGVWCGKQMLPEKNEIKTKGQKVLVIKPRTFATGEQIQKLNEIKPNINGAVIIPNYCDYEFGEIERIVIEGSKNEN